MVADTQALRAHAGMMVSMVITGPAVIQSEGKMGTETKHTPGPWETTGHYVYGPNDEDICEVEDAKNSTVIAAAPELLAALQIIQEKIDAGESGESEMADLLLQIGKITDDAIAKATGSGQ